MKLVVQETNMELGLYAHVYKYTHIYPHILLVFVDVVLCTNRPSMKFFFKTIVEALVR